MNFSLTLRTKGSPAKVSLMNWFRLPAIISILFLLLSCGIEEYYYLPQVPENNITSRFTDSATVILPSISEYYYAVNYSIFYRIYISGSNTTSIETSNMSSINPELSRNYNTLSRYTDAADTSVTSLNTFKDLNYFELELDGENTENIFTKNGGTLNILFPTALGSYPTVRLNDGDEINLHRSSELTSPSPEDDPTFRNTPELNDNDNATNLINADVSGRTGIDQRYAYVSMYVVARGYNNELFSPIFSKPTHINIFRLPDIN